MSARPPARSTPPGQSRRGASAAPEGALPRSISWARSLWKRAPQQAGPAETDRLQAEIRAELRVRLLVHDRSAVVARNLFHVHKAMGQPGWAGVAALPAQLLRGAVSDAEAMQAQEPTPLLALLVERLRELHAAVHVPEAIAVPAVAEQPPEWAATDFPDVPEVSEGSHDDFEVLERSWIGTVPSRLLAPERDRMLVMPHSGIPITLLPEPVATVESPVADEPAPAFDALDDHTEAAPPLDGTLAETDGEAEQTIATEPSGGRAEAAGLDVFVAIEKLAALHAKGILTEAEFTAKKSELLGRL